MVSEGNYGTITRVIGSILDAEFDEARLPAIYHALKVEVERTVLGETMPNAPVAVLSGPTFAKEVARGLPTAVTLACADEALGEALIAALGSRTFRPYLSGDIIGAQIGGAVKNVLAIACGVVSGRGLGENARASVITRGMAEILRLGQAMGGDPTTMMGLSGLGDLVLTCSSPTSRNRRVSLRASVLRSASSPRLSSASESWGKRAWRLARGRASPRLARAARARRARPPPTAPPTARFDGRGWRRAISASMMPGPKSSSLRCLLLRAVRSSTQQ